MIAEAAVANARFLLAAGEKFASSLDEATVLQNVVAISVPALADWCAVDLFDGDGTLKTVAAYPSSAGELHREAMAVPLKVRGTVIGMMRLVVNDSVRQYGDDEMHLAAELAHRAAMAIDNARLYAEAANANHAKDIFLATLSHEIKTPLTAILGWTRMLRAEGPSSDLFDEALSAVEQSARVQERLIEDILDVSRVITGKLNIEKRPVDLFDVVSAAVEIVTPMAEQNGVRMRVQAQTGVTVDGDETRLRQVIWNLLTNAIKFTPAGGFVEIITAKSDAEVSVTVRDSGRGIKPQTIPHLFEQFHQESVATRARHGGLGLGLAIVRHLVVAHGGRVAAHSEGEGKGSEFTVTLPLVTADVTNSDGDALMVQEETIS